MIKLIDKVYKSQIEQVWIAGLANANGWTVHGQYLIYYLISYLTFKMFDKLKTWLNNSNELGVVWIAGLANANGWTEHGQSQGNKIIDKVHIGIDIQQDIDYWINKTWINVNCRVGYDNW